ncbi:MAG: class D sortase [Ruthenibacterium sp.]
MTKPKSTSDRLSYILFPAAFAVLTSVILYMIFAPALDPYLTLAKYMFTGTAKVQSADLFSNLQENLADSGEVALSEITYPQNGDLYGKLTIPGSTVDAPVYYGDAPKQLNNGAGTYVNSVGAGLPGENKTILLGGHNTTFFNGLQTVKEGDTIVFDTNYGKYKYEVTKMQVADADATDTYDFNRTDENLILYTCYPFDAFGLTPERYFVYAKYTSGPKINADK